ncbi:sulfite exporter TauE/SafE family protein [Clostridium sp. D2Q-11]|uniref:Probable membrane transporter protein n=1 Tax=Anaeromonas frigoriresistens TaxID=2683708 RepID=A0A942UUK1_9FIRM|nr:sulfite exporter TauE/SafE family protein [Anaeromonas frigoriresistens]MBS4537745.1 sulfite exporter TauE/SafE family protein [Anaeromonas frigoriresistens]
MLLILIGIIIIFTAGMIQGITSFGFSLLAVPLLGIIMPLKLIVPILVIFSLIMNSMILYKVREYVNLKKIILLIISAIIATPIGANILMNFDENLLKIGVGIIVTISAIAFYLGYKVKFKNEKLAYIPVGILSGLLNGSVSLSGPPVIIFLTNQGVGKQIFRSALTAYFWILNIMTIFTFIYKGLITEEVIKYSVYLLPSLIIGVTLGIRLGDKVKEEVFEKLTVVLIIFMGILSIISGVR